MRYSTKPSTRCFPSASVRKSASFPYNSRMHVYFMHTVATDHLGSKHLYKVGYAADVAKRLAQLQTGCPMPIQLFGTLKCTSRAHAADIERRLHLYFASRRRLGEWFIFAARHTWTIRLLIRDWPIEQPLEEYLELAFGHAQRMKNALLAAGLPVWKGMSAVESLKRGDLIDTVVTLSKAGVRRH